MSSSFKLTFPPRDSTRQHRTESPSPPPFITVAEVLRAVLEPPNRPTEGVCDVAQGGAAVRGAGYAFALFGEKLPRLPGR